jgi:hypothetical protein
LLPMSQEEQHTQNQSLTDPANRTVEFPQAKSLNLRGLHRRQSDEEQPSASRSDSVREMNALINVASV